MARFRPVTTGVVVALVVNSWAFAGQAAGTQQSGATPPQTAGTQASGTQAKPGAKPEEQKPPAKPDEPQKITRREDVVVSASKVEQKLVDSPVTISVINEKTLALSPSGSYADILRNVPGTNVTQMSARDINVNQRGATGSLATGQLTVVDGRSVYLDFFGFTMWEFVPNDLDQLKQVEVIRGPASAIWGANALTGVVSFITKTPRELAGDGTSESFAFGIGTFNTAVNDNGAENGTMFYARGNFAQAVNDRWSYKVSAGYYDSDPLARPVGTIPNGTGTLYPSFMNEGSQQPRIDARVDYDFADGASKLIMAGGYGGTSGMMNTGIGPFRIENDAKLGFWQATYTRKALKLQTFMNVLDGSATNVVSVDPTGQPVALTFAPKTFDVEFGDTRLAGKKNVITYGGNLRYNRFYLSIAPGENQRTEGGAYIQDEFVPSEHFRIVVGGRVDSFSSIEDPVFSPRVALVMKPTASQSVKVSYNRAYRAPSMVNNHLETVIGTKLQLSQINAGYGSAVYYIPTTALGNKNLKEEAVDAYEVAYTGYIGKRTLVSAAVYYTNYEDGIYFTETGYWGPTTPPPGFPGLGPVPPGLVWFQFATQAALQGVKFPSSYTYQNLGTVVNKGIELGVDTMFNETFSGYVNYAFQADPIPSFPDKTEEQALNEINRPSAHQFNVGISWNTRRVFGMLGVSSATEAFWQDVLDSRYHGTTKAYTSVNATFGVKFADGRYMASVKATNLGNQEIQQHIFGDVLKRQIVGEFKMFLK